MAELVENTIDAVLFLDQEGIVRYWNVGAKRMFQYERAEVLGTYVGFLVPADLMAFGELKKLKAAGELDGVIYNHLTRRVRKDGRELWVSLTRTVLHDERGEAIGVVATLRDVTEQRSREEELRQSRELAIVGELSAKIAHEVKNPLTGIFAALQVLEGQLDEKDPRREIFASIGDEVMRLNELTQQLLRFARPRTPKPRRGDLAKFVVDLVDDLERISMVEPGVVELFLPSQLFVEFDPDLTAEVLRNLILNAVETTKEQKSVMVGSSISDAFVALDIADSGPGVPVEQRAQIFEPFFTTKARGTGLGLAIARKSMEVQGGRIQLRSHPGRGATFRLEFPRQTFGSTMSPT